jgi:uncharacterized membrane protein YidH (DUF202 family)
MKPRQNRGDNGLARERTELAWLRTSISLTALGAAVAKTTLLTGLSILGIAVTVWVISLVTRTQGRRPADPLRAQAITVATVAVAVAALIVALRGGADHGLR